jgi:hypothetical protein
MVRACMVCACVVVVWGRGGGEGGGKNSMIGVMTTSLLAGCQNALQLSFELLARALDQLQLLLVLACLKEGDGSGEHDAQR